MSSLEEDLLKWSRQSTGDVWLEEGFRVIVELGKKKPKQYREDREKIRQQNYDFTFVSSSNLIAFLHNGHFVPRSDEKNISLIGWHI